MTMQKKEYGVKLSYFGGTVRPEQSRDFISHIFAMRQGQVGM